MDFISEHNEMMWNFMVALFFKESDTPHFNRGMELLRSGRVDPFQMDNQLFRELRLGRWSEKRTLEIYNEIAYYIIRNRPVRDSAEYIKRMKEP
jgi:hypothetical protein